MNKLLSPIGRNLRILLLRKKELPQTCIQYSSLSESKARNTEAFSSSDKKPSPKDIVVPTRIERGPTDILEALASTVGRDYTAPQYRYHDDPYLIPTSNLSKRSYALSKEAGRKAARWARQQLPELFYHKNADPPILSYLPDPTIENAKEITEETVLTFIKLGLITEATKAYEALAAKGTGISKECKQTLLEATAFCNGSDMPDEEWLEDKWFQSSAPYKERIKNTWDNEGFAERLFKEMESPDGEAYTAMILGTSKYFHIEKAYALFQEALQKEIKLNVEAFNAIIGIINFMHEDAEARKSLLMDTLVQMKNAGLTPNIRTFNSALETCALCGSSRIARKLVPQIWAEFTQLGIQPSLASYYYLLLTYYRRGRQGEGASNAALHVIMDGIENKEFEVQDTRDIQFLASAMEIACTTLQDLELSDRIQRFASTGSNYQFMGDSFKESAYYRHFFNLRLELETFDDFMKIYDLLVPNVYNPELNIMSRILEVAEMNQAVEVVPRLWSDLVIFDQHRREETLTRMLQLLSKLIPANNDPKFEIFGKKFMDIAWTIWLQQENQDATRAQYVSWTGKMLGDLMTVLTKSKELNRAAEVLKKLMTPNSRVLGVPSVESLHVFLQACIQNRQNALALACVQYTQEAGFPEAAVFGEEVFLALELDILQRNKLNSILGFNVEASATAKRANQSSTT